MRKIPDDASGLTSQSGGAPVARHQDAASRAYLLLRVGFVALPIVMGLDKFTNYLTFWPDYLAPWLVGVLPFSAQTAMYVVGVIEIVAGLVVAVAPRYGAPIVALWLAGIIVNLLTYSGYYDVALRDVGLLVGALALTQLAVAHDRSRPGTGGGWRRGARPGGSFRSERGHE